MTLRIHLLGAFRLLDDDRPIAILQPRLQSLIAYLAMNRSAPQARRRLAFLFWPDSSEAQAHANLRRELYDLRGLWPEMAEFVHLDRQSLYWRDAQAVAVDVATFEARLAEAENGSHVGAAEVPLRQALELYGGELLPHLYDEWVLAERERLAGRYRAALARLTLALEQQGKIAEALETAQRLIAHDPLQESAYRTVMRLMMERGDWAGALRVYESCVAALREELGVEPGGVTATLYREIVGGSDPVAQRATHAALDDPPLVGRSAQWAKLQAAWRSAAGGQASFVLIAGESGIGKTRLMEELVAWAQLQGHSTAVTRSYEAEGRLAYTPVTEWLRAEAVQRGIVKLQAVWLTEVARLLPDVLTERHDVPPPEPLVDSWQRQRFREGLVRALLSVDSPLLLAIDDLQWCDSETLEWLHFLLRFDLRARLLIVGTMRVEAVDADHPLTALTTNLRRSGQYTEIALGALDAGATAELAGYVRGRALHVEQAASVYAETEGHPLFVVEMLRATETDGMPSVPIFTRGSALPPKVQAVIDSRLAQLSPEARALAGLAAIIGRAFTVKLLREAHDETEEARLVEALDELFKRRIISEKGADAYDFSHDKLREAARAAVSPARRRLLHRHIAEALETLHAADLDPVSGQLGSHYEQTGEWQAAIRYYRQAARVSYARYAADQTLLYLNRVLSILDTLPETTENLQQRVAALLEMAEVLIGIQGNTSVERKQILERAYELAKEINDSRQQIDALGHLSVVYVSQGDWPTAHHAALETMRLAEEVGEANYLCTACGQLSGTYVHRDDLPAAMQNFRRFFALAEVTGKPLRSVGTRRTRLAEALWLCGYPQQAHENALAGVQIVDQDGHPLGRCLARDLALNALQRLGDTATVRRLVGELAALCDTFGFPTQNLVADFFRGWLMAQEGAIRPGLAEMEGSIDRSIQVDDHFQRPYFLSLVAQAYAQGGEAAQALSILEKASQVADEQGDSMWKAEILRLTGDVSLQLERADHEVEKLYESALHVARRQGAKSLELRAAMSLARFWSHRERRRDAYNLVAEVYGWFTEGFDTPDLREAKRLLDELAPA